MDVKYLIQENYLQDFSDKIICKEKLLKMTRADYIKSLPRKKESNYYNNAKYILETKIDFKGR